MDQLLDFLLDLYGPSTYWVIFGVLLLCGFGLPVPEDITLALGGLLAYYGLADVYWMIFTGLSGVIVGDSVMYFLGAKFGKKIKNKSWFKKILSPEALENASERLKKAQGSKVLFAARFMPGLRAPIYFTAGMLHVPFKKFIFWDGLAALISVPAIMFALYRFGNKFEEAIYWIRKVEHGILFFIVAIVIFIALKYYLAKRKSLKI